MARRKDSSREEWPPNLSPNGKYYRYRNPVTGTVTSLPVDFQEACYLARAMNLTLKNEQQSNYKGLLAKMKGEGKPLEITLAIAVAEYQVRRMEERPNPRTQKTIKSTLATISKAPFANKPLIDITVLDLNDWMEQQKATMQPRLRRELIGVYQFAITKGWQPHKEGNPAEHIEKKTAPKRQRARLPFDRFKAIYAEASPRLKTCMYLMLHTTLRPIDCVNVKKSDISGGQLKTMIRKSRKDGDDRTAKYLDIELSDQEQAQLKALYSDNVMSPYVVHSSTKPKKLSKDADHWSQCSVDVLSREFMTISRRLYGDEHTPFYEIRALSKYLYDESGRDKEETQALMAHTDGETSAIYAEGHQPEYVKVRAGLDVEL